MKEKINLALDPEVVNQLREYSAQSGMKLSALVEQSIAMYLVAKKREQAIINCLRDKKDFPRFFLTIQKGGDIL